MLIKQSCDKTCLLLYDYVLCKYIYIYVYIYMIYDI